MSPLGWICCVTSFALVTGAEVPTCSKQLPVSLWSYTADLMQNLKKAAGSEENILVSPLNSYIALATLHLGAGKGTRAELAKVLKVPTDSTELTDSNLHETLSKVVKSIQTQSTGWGFPTSKVELANGLFVQKTFPIKESYTKQLQDYYNGSVSNVDFESSKETTDLMNNWISEKTLGRIPKFYDEPLEVKTLAILLSTLYFNARWKEEFMKVVTKEEKFSTGSSEITVPMMKNTDTIPYESNPSLQYDAITIPYLGEEYVMNIFLPHLSQTVKNLTDQIHLTSPLSVSESAKMTYVEYKIPKMKFNWKKSLAEALNVQGLFDNPDLSELSTKAVKISKLVHATEIEVDEEGTVASAVSSIQLAKPSAAWVPSEKPIQFYVNRPFLVGITHKPTCTLLFTGIVHKPI